MDINQEIMKHLEWIESVVSLIGNKAVSKEEIQGISSHDRCELGRWLDSDESVKYKNLSVFERLKESHEAFHSLAGELISAFEEGNEDQAVASQERFVALSQEVIGYLRALEAYSGGDS